MTFFNNFWPTGAWKAIFAPSCILNPDDNDGVYCCLRLRSFQIQCPVLSIVFSFRQKVRSYLQVPNRSSPTQDWAHSSVHININLCASKKNMIGVCVRVKRNVKNVSMAMPITLLNMSRMTPSFNKSLVGLVGAHYQSPHSTNMEHRCRNLEHQEFYSP